MALSCVIVCSAGPQNALADEFLKRSVIFETKVFAHLDKGLPLDRFNVLLMSANPLKLGAEQEARCNVFTANRGVIIRGRKGQGGDCGTRRSRGRRCRLSRATVASRSLRG